MKPRPCPCAPTPTRRRQLPSDEPLYMARLSYLKYDLHNYTAHPQKAGIRQTDF